MMTPNQDRSDFPAAVPKILTPTLLLKVFFSKLQKSIKCLIKSPISFKIKFLTQGMSVFASNKPAVCKAAPARSQSTSYALSGFVAAFVFKRKTILSQMKLENFRSNPNKKRALNQNRNGKTII
jgi:hypothetical protein